MGFYEAAIAENNQAVMGDSALLLGIPLQGMAFARAGRSDAALQTVKQAERVEPTSPFLTFAFGNIAFFRGDLSQAETEWRRLVQMDPARARAPQIGEVALALVAKRRGQVEEGRRVLNKFRDRPGFGEQSSHQTGCRRR